MSKYEPSSADLNAWVRAFLGAKVSFDEAWFMMENLYRYLEGKEQFPREQWDAITKRREEASYG